MPERIWNNNDLKAIYNELVLNGGSSSETLIAILAKIIAAPATEAKQDTLIAKDFATQTTLAAALAKVIAAPSTEAKQDTLIAKDFATQTTLAALLAKVIAAPATEAKQDTGNTSLASLLALHYLPKGNEFYGFSSDLVDNIAYDIVPAGG